MNSRTSGVHHERGSPREGLDSQGARRPFRSTRPVDIGVTVHAPKPPSSNRTQRSRSGKQTPGIEPLCCTPAGIGLPNVSPEELTQRIAALEAQSAEAMRNLQQLYEAEHERARELEVTRAQMLAYADDLRMAFAAERARRAELEGAYVETVRVLARAVEARDLYTGGHVDRVATYATAIGRELGWKEEILRAVEIGGLLHDIGKIGITDAILRKDGPLDDHEWQLMRQHPTIGAGLVGSLAALQPSVPAVLYHHERFDGEGYPTGLAGEAIPAIARVVAVADAFDAMVTDRPYRRGLDLKAAMEELTHCAGTQFDPEFTGAFLELLRSSRMLPLRMGSTLS